MFPIHFDFKDKHVCLWLMLENFQRFSEMSCFDTPTPAWIQANSIKFHQILDTNLDLLQMFIYLRNLGNMNNLKDTIVCLYLSPVWCRKSSTLFQKYHVPVLLPQPDIQPNNISFIKIYAIIWIYHKHLFCRLLGTLMIWKTNTFTCLNLENFNAFQKEAV